MNSNRRIVGIATFHVAAALLVAGAAIVPSVAAAQETAGRVLIAVGDVAVVRGSQRIAAQRGTEVQTGDTIQVGAQSNSQIRLTDDSIISLRPETTFRLTEYAFAGKQPQEQRAFYQLVAGGIRTVTGLIGKLNQENYGVKTETATIGIRGTHFSLVECNNSCRNPNGSLAANGTYGGVTDGRISVTNQSGETVFGSDQFFQVASSTALPQALIAPPGFLRDTLEGRTRNLKPAAAPTIAQKPAAGQAASAGSDTTVMAPTGSGAGTSDSGSGSVTASTAPASLSTNVFQVTADAALTGLANFLQPTGTGTVFYRMQGPVNIPVSCSSPPCSSIVAGEFTLAVNLTLLRAQIAANFQTSNGGRFNLASPVSASGFPISVSNGQVVFGGTFNLSDFPNNTGAFRCENCGPSGVIGFVQSLTVDGTLSGGTASVKLTGTDGAGTASFPITLTLQAPPNSAVAAIATPRQFGGVDARSFAFWNVQVDPAGKLLGAGPLIGGPLSAVNTASNTIDGSAPSAGNLVWGHWSGPGALITDSNYASFTTGAGSIQPWITGTAPNTLPPSLGTLSYTPVGSFMVGTGVLNNANLTADFVNRSLTLGINATNPTVGNTFQMNAQTGFSTLNGRFSAGFNSVTCTGPCTGGGVAGSFGGFFAGPNAEGAGVVFAAGFGNNNTGVTGAVGFKR
jgi:hypothetical protein